MKKIIQSLLLITTILACNTGYTSELEYESEVKELCARHTSKLEPEARILQDQANTLYSEDADVIGVISDYCANDVKRKVLTGHTGIIYSVAISPNGKKIASGSEDKTIRLWDIETGRCSKKLTGHTGMIHSVAFSPNGRFLASASNDIRVWDTTTGRCLQHILNDHTGPVTSVIFSPCGNILASTSANQNASADGINGIIRLWDTTIYRCLRELTGHTNTVTSVVFSQDSQMLASASTDRTTRLWNIATGKCSHRLTARTYHPYLTNPVYWINSVALSPDGKILASGSGDGTNGIIHLWNTKTGNLFHELAEHTDQVISVIFSPCDNNILASGSGDSTMRVWNIATGKCLRRLTGHAGPVTSVVFTPDGQTLVSASNDKIIRVSDLKKCLSDL